MRLLLV